MTILFLNFLENKIEILNQVLWNIIIKKITVYFNLIVKMIHDGFLFLFWF